MNALIVFQHGDLSKAIRQGDWQIVEQKDKLTSRQVVAEEGLV
jgi:hypothetical protein